MTAEEIRDLERASIRAFVESCSDHFEEARVLDYGSGLSPYREIVEQAGGDYVPHDRVAYPANVSGADVGPDYWDLGSFDAVLASQIIQYHTEPFELLLDFRNMLRNGGTLILTGPECWPAVEQEDLFRFTRAGARWMLVEAGFEVLRLEQRASVSVAPGFELSLGWGAVARA